MRPRNEKLDKEIGIRIRAIRTKHHYTIEQLAEKMDISAKHLGEVERGQTGSSYDTLIAAATALDCSTDYLLTGKEYAETGFVVPTSLQKILYRGTDEEISLFEEYLLLFVKLRSK